jgi:hypothetical protein
MATEIAGFFRTRAQGEWAYQALRDNGFSNDEVSFLAGDEGGHETPALGPVESIGAESEAGEDALMGGLAGMTAGVIAAAIPGLGPLFLAGPFAVALGGMTLGVAAGGLVGFLKDRGVEQKDADFIAEGVARGGALVTVHNLTADRQKKARAILDKFGAIDTEDLGKESAA